MSDKVLDEMCGYQSHQQFPYTVHSQETLTVHQAVLKHAASHDHYYRHPTRKKVEPTTISPVRMSAEDEDGCSRMNSTNGVENEGPCQRNIALYQTDDDAKYEFHIQLSLATGICLKGEV